MEDLFDADVKINAKRYSNFWRTLYSSSYLSSESSEKILQIADLPHDEKLLRQGIPHDMAFSHKIGTYGDIHSDSGIIYAQNRPYILTVMIEGDETSVENLMADISRSVYEYVTKK